MAKKKKKSSKKYYYAFVAVVLIIVIAVTLLDYKFRFGIVNWGEILHESSTSEEGSQSNIEVNVDEIGNLKITFIDVGQGDAILVNLPDGRNMLIDAGESSAKDELDEHLTVNGEKLKLDYVVATHTDSDHIGAMSYVYDNYEVGCSYRPYVEYSGTIGLPDGFINEGYEEKATSTYGEYLSAIASEGTPHSYFTDASDFTVSVNAGEFKSDYTIDFVMPYAKTTEGFKDFTDSNDFSAVIIIKFAGKKVILTGDMEAEAEAKFVEYYTQNPSEKSSIDCDVLKVAHHGSATSSTMGFLDLIKPEHSVISTGVCHGTYMHPRATALNNLIAVGSSIYRTDLQGTITLTITAEGEISFDYQFDEYNEYLFMDAYEIEHLKEEIKNYKEQNA
ncbi:MAG: MBL fold metallo-hydrolase [Clostridia bacterium]|nr:MBL fold metallo-hydrolase [Clostridia bacterium]